MHYIETTLESRGNWEKCWPISTINKLHTVEAFLKISSHLKSQEIPHPLWYLNVYYRVQSSPPVDLIMR
jgi:hypothetical protein